MAGLRKDREQFCSSSVSSTAVKNWGKWEVLFFHTQKVKQGMYNTRRYNVQDKSTPVTIM